MEGLSKSTLKTCYLTRLSPTSVTLKEKLSGKDAPSIQTFATKPNITTNTKTASLPVHPARNKSPSPIDIAL